MWFHDGGAVVKPQKVFVFPYFPLEDRGWG